MSDKTKKNQPVDLSRRKALKGAAVGVCAGIAAPLLSKVGSVYAAPAQIDDSKILIVYYTRTGNTEHIARQIGNRVGGTSVALQTVDPYPADYRATTVQAKEELERGYRPPLSRSVDDISGYDVVFVGSPNWWGTVAPAVMTFLEKHDFSGKRIVPFITHEGSRLGNSVSDIRRLAPAANVLEGLAVRGRSVAGAQGDVDAWLRGLGLAA